MTKFEIFITPSSEDYLEVNIFSRVKMEWVYNDSVRVEDVFFLLSDLQVNAGNSIIRMAPETALYKEFIEGGYTVRKFNKNNLTKHNKMKSIKIISPEECVKITKIGKDSFTVVYDKAPHPDNKQDLIIQYNK